MATTGSTPSYTAYGLSGTTFSDSLTINSKVLATGGEVYTTAGAPAGVLGDGTDTFLFDGAIFTYEGTASVSGTAGFVGLDASNGHYYFFAEYNPAAPFNPAKGTHLSDAQPPLPGQPVPNGEFNVGTDTTGCFVEGTRIATAVGATPVEALKAGDLVRTAGGVVRPVRWIGYSIMSLFGADPAAVRPIRITAGALGANIPVRDLLVSPGHAVFVDGILAHASALVNGSTIVQDQATPLVFKYFHVELDAHDLVLAEGAQAESFIEIVTEMAMDNWSERALISGEAPNVEMAYPRVKSVRQLPVAVRERLARQAQVLAGGESIAA